MGNKKGQEINPTPKRIKDNIKKLTMNLELENSSNNNKL
jgi:hypothetical protein